MIAIGMTAQFVAALRIKGKKDDDVLAQFTEGQADKKQQEAQFTEGQADKKQQEREQQRAELYVLAQLSEGQADKKRKEIEQQRAERYAEIQRENEEGLVVVPEVDEKVSFAGLESFLKKSEYDEIDPQSLERQIKGLQKRILEEEHFLALAQDPGFAAMITEKITNLKTQIEMKRQQGEDAGFSFFGLDPRTTRLFGLKAHNNETTDSLKAHNNERAQDYSRAQHDLGIRMDKTFELRL
jgi:hypothetical protein